MICNVCEAVIQSFNPCTGRPYNAAIKAHNRGKRHQRGCTPREFAERIKEEQRIAAEIKAERYARYERRANEYQAALADVAGKTHALILGVLVTRLRTEYGEMSNARQAWQADAVQVLRLLADSQLEKSVLNATTTALTLRKMNELLIRDYELLRLILSYM
jgi:hypothetical protein